MSCNGRGSRKSVAFGANKPTQQTCCKCNQLQKLPVTSNYFQCFFLTPSDGILSPRRRPANVTVFHKQMETVDTLDKRDETNVEHFCWFLQLSRLHKFFFQETVNFSTINSKMSSFWPFINPIRRSPISFETTNIMLVIRLITTLPDWLQIGVQWGGNGVPTPFCISNILQLKGLDYIKTCLRSHRCASDTQIRTASQKSTVKQEDPMWKLLQANAHFIRTIWCSLPLYMAVPTPYFLAIHPWLQLPSTVFTGRHYVMDHTDQNGKC